jgi:hypothetical protein
MSIWQDIIDKLGLANWKPGQPAGAPKPAAPTGGGMIPGSGAAAGTGGGMGAGQQAPMAMVDVMSKLEAMGKKAPELDWKVSIVDMLKLLGIDSSLNARKELAKELGCPPDLIGGDYAKMNVWLQQTVLQKIAQNGGNIPASLLK